MRTITFSAIKGGVGKSSLAILTANALAANGKSVLIIDADPQNSTTSYYFPELPKEIANRNLANVLAGELLLDNRVSTSKHEKIDLIPSSLDLLMQRNCDTSELKAKLASGAAGFIRYDYCIIDTAPTLDNVVISCLSAADIIITPITLTSFDLKSAAFFKQQLEHLDLLDNWALLINKYRPVKSAGSIAASILKLLDSDYFANQYGQPALLNAKIPESAAVKAYVETNTTISRAKDKVSVYDAMASFLGEIGEEIVAERF